MDRAFEQGGDPRDGEVVDVAERQRGAVMRTEAFERIPGAKDVELDVPRVLVR